MRRQKRLKIWFKIVCIAFIVGVVLQFTLPKLVNADSPLGEVIADRTQTSITTYLGNGVYSVDSSINAVHYQDTQGNWQNIDNTINSVAQAYGWQTAGTAPYQANFTNIFNAGMSLKVNALGQSVSMQPSSLTWTNDSTATSNTGTIQTIASPQAVTASVTNPVVNLIGSTTTHNGTITYNNAYGTGTSFSWECQPTRVAKLLTINSLSNLTAPNSSVTSGTNPVLRLTLFFLPSSGVNIFLDGQQWDKLTTKTSFNIIEFRDASNNVLWGFDPLMYWDSAGNSGQSGATVRWTGAYLSIEIRVPYPWLQTAVFPVYIDTSLDYQVGATLDDGYTYQTTLYTSGAGNDSVGYYVDGTTAVQSFFRWAGVTIPDDATIGSNTYVSAYSAGYLGTLANIHTRLFFNDAAAAVSPTTVALYNGKAVTTAYTDLTPSAWTSGNWYNVDCHLIVTELMGKYSYAAGAAMMALWKNNASTGDNFLYITDYSTNTSYAPKLHIEYTAGGSNPTVVTAQNNGSAYAPTSITTTGATVGEQCTNVGSPASDSAWGTNYGVSATGGGYNGYNSQANNTGTQTSGFSWYDSLSGLSSGYLYHYQGYSTNSNGTGYGSDSTFLTLPGAGSSFTPTAGNTQVSFTWTAFTGETSPVTVTIESRVNYRTDQYPTAYNDGSATVGIDWTASTSGTVTSLVNGTLYYFALWTEDVYAGTTTEYSTADATTTSTPTSGVTVATITISAATSVTSTTATLNGNITATGGDNPTVTVYWGTSDGGQTPASWANSHAPDSPSQPQGVASFSYAASSLSTGTTYYFSAKATNSAGDAWPANSLTLLTIPAAPTGVSATDGTYTTKVTITWTKSTGATNYKVYRTATNDSGTLGDVATYDDTAAGVPTITPGTASATDGSSTSYVTCTLSGQSASNGSTESYTVYAYDATGWSSASSGDNGYRGTTTLTYQWQRSDADSDSAYNTNTGTTNPYNDTGAPAPSVTAGTASASNGTSTSYVTLSISGQSANSGAKRYFRCVVSMSGATNQNSTADEGYIGVGSLTYQWYRSAANSDASYSTLSGATTASYNDSTAPAPSVTPGTASATDGSSTSYVTLSLSGQSASAGDGRYYYCTVSATGASNQDTNHTSGYIGVGSLTYQWYRSAADSDASYSSISGGTTAPYNDTVPVPSITAGTASATGGTYTSKITLSISGQGTNLDKRYFKCYVSATGASPQYSTSDEGWIGVGSLTYQWYRSSGSSDGSYSLLSGATTAPYDDSTAPTPTITPGTATVSNGTDTSAIDLSISGQSANNGASRYYYCDESATGASDQNTNHTSGYIGVGSLTYQWERSAGSSDASYSTLSGATTASYNDSTAPSPSITVGTASATSNAAYVTISVSGQSANNGDSRYYYCTLSATGVSDNYTNHASGYIGVGSLTYQWYACTTSGGSYSSIGGATSNPYNDSTAAGAPSITAGSTTASQGGTNPYVTISVSGNSLTPGATEYYKCYENATGVSQQITAYTSGNITGGSISLQGQRSAADSDASYSDISGATSSPYNDTAAPSNGVKRYFRYREDAGGATEVFAVAMEGWTNYVGLPGPPTNFTITQTGTNSITISWTNDPSATSTVIQALEDSQPGSPTSGFNVYNGSGTSVDITGLNLGTSTYYYSAWSYNGQYSASDAMANIGGAAMLFFALIAIAGLITFLAFKNTKDINMALVIASAGSWAILMAYVIISPPGGLVAGSTVQQLIVVVLGGVAMAVLVGGMRLNATLKIREEAEEQQQEPQDERQEHRTYTRRQPPQGYSTSSRVTPYRARVHAALHPHKPKD